MKKKARAHTFCKTCNRVVWKDDVDKDGNCCFCPKTKAASGGTNAAETETKPSTEAAPADADKTPERTKK